MSEFIGRRTQLINRLAVSVAVKQPNVVVFENPVHCKLSSQLCTVLGN